MNALDAPITRTMSDGEEYTFAPLGMGILFGEFREFIKERRRAELTALDESPSVKIELYDRWIRDGVHIVDCLREAMTVDGAEWIAWRALKPAHPGIARGDVIGLFGSPGELVEMRDELVNFPEASEDDADPQMKESGPM